MRCSFVLEVVALCILRRRNVHNVATATVLDIVAGRELKSIPSTGWCVTRTLQPIFMPYFIGRAAISRRVPTVLYIQRVLNMLGR